MGNLRSVAGTVVVACLLTAGALGPGGIARATTGPSSNLPPTYKVSSKFGQQFIGQYIMTSVPAAAHLRSAALGIEVKDTGFLYGIGQFYGYEASGSQSSWVATLYHFHQTGKAQMTIDLLVPVTASNLIGRLFVAPPKHNILNGKIQIGANIYPISFRRISAH